MESLHESIRNDLNRFKQITESKIIDDYLADGPLWSVYWVDDRGHDNNALVRAESAEEAVSAIDGYEDVDTEEGAPSARLMDADDFRDSGITRDDVARADSEGYYIYDSGT